MATKNLARTVIEGGRMGYNKYERRLSSRIERHCVRQLLHSVINETEIVQKFVIPTRKKVPKDFNDKTNPVERWLKSRTGKKWNITHSMIFRKFETRTMAGRHIVFDHILSAVVPYTSVEKHFSRYIIDENGTLIHIPHKKRLWERDLHSYEPEVSKWLNNRLVGKRGNYLFWFVPAKKVFRQRWLILFGYRMTYRQEEKLSSEDIEFFHSLTKKAQRQLFERGAEYVPNIVL